MLRDLGGMPDGFPIVAGRIGPSHGFVHVHDIATPVDIFDMTANSGDLIHADRHGAVCVPPDVLPNLDASLDCLFAAEAIVLDPLKDGGIDLEKFEDLWGRFEKART